MLSIHHVALADSSCSAPRLAASSEWREGVVHGPINGGHGTRLGEEIAAIGRGCRSNQGPGHGEFIMSN